VRKSGAAAAADGRARYVMLGTLRAYAAGLGADANSPAARLAEFMLGVAEAAAARPEDGAEEITAGRAQCGRADHREGPVIALQASLAPLRSAPMAQS